APLIGKLVGVQLDRQSTFFGGIEYARGLRRRKGDALAERVDRIRKLDTGGRGQHLVANQCDIVVSTPGEFGRQRMGAEKSRPDFDSACRREAAGGAQHLELIRGIEAITGLDLDSGDSFG